MKTRILSIALAVLMLAAVMPLSSTPALAAAYTYEVILEPTYSGLNGNLKDGFVAVNRNGLWGFIDAEGNELTPCKYESATESVNGMAIVKLNGKSGAVNREGALTVPCKYDEIWSFNAEGYAWVILSGGRGVVDRDGNEVIPCEYQTASYLFNDMFYVVEENGNRKVMDRDGNEAADTSMYTGVGYVGHDLAAVGIGDINNDKGQWGLVDSDFNEVMPAKYTYILPFNKEGLALVKFGSKWGVIDTTGKEIVAVKYDDILTDFDNGLIGVKSDGKWGYVDVTGKEVIAPKYDFIWPFANGRAVVGNGYETVEFGIIDTAGNEVLPIQYDWLSISEQSDGFIAAGLNGKQGVLDRNFKEVVPFQYKNIGTPYDGVAPFNQNGKWGLLKIVEATEALNLSTADGWAESGIQEAYDKGFIPDDLQGNYKNIITRAEFCRMAVQWVEYRTGKTIDAVIADKGLTVRQDAFSDTKDPYILAAYTLGITSGTVAPTATSPGTFTPNGDFSRQQAAVMIMNACKVIGMDTAGPPTSDFVDLNDADSWARAGINFVRANGIMGGNSTDPTKPKFSPKLTYTRQESIVTFNNIK